MGPTILPDGPNDASEFHLAFSRDRFEELTYVLAADMGPNADEPERGAYCVITRSRGRDRVTYLVKEVVVPEDGEVYWADQEAEDEYGLQFNPGYKRRARRRAEATEGGGILIVHTHPGGTASPSGGDLSADLEDLYTPAMRLESDAPLAAAIYSESGSWHVRAYEINVARTPAQRESDEFGPETATTTPATAIRVIGDEFSKLATTERATGPAGTRGEIDPELVDSSIRIWEREGQEQLAGLRVGVVGCGGGGSILAEWVSRLGVGALVLVDYDHLEPANYNRAQGAIPVDLEQRRLKVRVAAREAELSAVAKNFSVRPVVGSVVESRRGEYDPLVHLLDCDIIINAADPHWVRKVLDDLAFANLIPVFDGGTSLDTDEHGQLTSDAQSNISLSAPGHPCLACSDVWTDDGVSEDKENPSARSYTDEEEERAPSVISMNGFVVSLIIQRLQAFVLGVAPQITVGSLRYSPQVASLRWRQKGSERMTSCYDTCDRPTLEAAGNPANSDLDRFLDPGLTEHLEDGCLTVSGVVEPAPLGRNIEDREVASGEVESESGSLLSRILDALLG